MGKPLPVTPRGTRRCLHQLVGPHRARACLLLPLEATARLGQERQALDRLCSQRLEGAERRSRLVEPEHRLVAQQPAQEWEARLTAQWQLQDKYERFVQPQSQPLSAAERTAIAQLLLRNFKHRWLMPGFRPASGQGWPPFCASRRSHGYGSAGDILRSSDHEMRYDG